jgi:hypothetical protein
MPDTKITALTAIGANPIIPATFPIPMVDLTDTSMAASGTTKKVTVNQILGSGGTATLASATITGDLTVDTSTLKVDSTNNRVLVGTTSAYGRLTVGVGSGAQTSTITNAASSLYDIDYTSSGTINTRLSFVNANGITNAAIDRIGNPSLNDSGNIAFLTRSGSGSLTERYRIAADGVATWSEVGGVAGTAMTLNSTGLGIGASPSYKLHIGDSQASQTTIYVDNQANDPAASSALTLSAYGGNWNLSVPRSATFVNPLIFKFGSTEMMRIDASGNLLVGTTSALSAWATRLTLSTDAGTTKWAVGPYADPNNFIISASGSFGVYLNGTSAVSWTGISDERLKDIIEPISNAVAKVGQLRSVIGKFKADETNTRRSFLLAQDVQAVLPEAVDASNPDRLGVAYTDVIPLLVAAIKELAARVQTLEAK